MAASAVGAENPMVDDIHPDVKPATGWYIFERKLYSPPDLGSAEPSSA